MEDIVNYYVNLLILQYRNKTKASATISLLAEQGLVDLLPLQINSAFSIDNSVGAQLDTLGVYAGVTRSASVDGVVISLNDTDFRSLIKMSIAKNTYFSSLYDIQNLINTFFPDVLYVFDFKNMAIGYFLDTSAGTEDFAKLVIANNLLPKPMGVRIASLIYSSNIDSFYGFISYEVPYQVNTFGMNDYNDYVETVPWLDYNDSISA